MSLYDLFFFLNFIIIPCVISILQEDIEFKWIDKHENKKCKKTNRHPRNVRTHISKFSSLNTIQCFLLGMFLLPQATKTIKTTETNSKQYKS